MDKKLLKDIINVKLRLADCLTGQLPHKVRGRVAELRTACLEASAEVIGEYLENKKKADKKDTAVNDIKIE